MLVTYLFSMRIVKHRVNSSLIVDVFIGLHFYYFYAIEHMLQQKDGSVNFSHYHHHDK